jgi:hypothetical protein
MQTKAITICMRVYPGITRNPVIKGPKLQTFSKCLSSLLIACVGFKVNIIFLLDACPIKFEKLILDLTKKYQVPSSIVRHANRSGVKSFLMQLELLTDCNTELVGLVEDDYIFDSDAISTILKLNEIFPDDYYTLFNSADYYELNIHDYIKPIHRIGDILCMEVASTTFTFFTNKKNLVTHRKNFSSYRLNNNDYTIWLSITKRYRKLLTLVISGYFSYRKIKYVLKLIKFFYLLKTPRRKLIVSIPGRAVHLDPIGFSRDHEIKELTRRLNYF